MLNEILFEFSIVYNGEKWYNKRKKNAAEVVYERYDPYSGRERK